MNLRPILGTADSALRRMGKSAGFFSAAAFIHRFQAGIAEKSIGFTKF